MKKIFVTDVSPGDTVDAVFALAARTVARKKDGDSFLRLVLSDKTGSLNAVVWDGVGRAEAETATAAFVRVLGDISEYRGSPQLIVKKITACEAADVDPADFLPVTGGDVHSMFRRLLGLTRSMSSEPLKSLLNLFWNDDLFVEQMFKRAPAAKLMHHAYLGGLLEHTLAVAEMAVLVADRYGDALDRDLLLAGAILHDIGKTREFSYDYVFDYTDEGRLLNHLVLGVTMVEEKLALLPDFPPETALLLKHLIVSHHGSREFGSPEPPKTLEALVLNHIDEIDSKVTGIGAFMDSHEAGQTWTAFHKPMDRFFYIGDQKQED